MRLWNFPLQHNRPFVSSHRVFDGEPDVYLWAYARGDPDPSYRWASWDWELIQVKTLGNSSTDLEQSIASTSDYLRQPKSINI